MFCLTGADGGLRIPFALLRFSQLSDRQVTSLLAPTAAPRPLAFPLFHAEPGPFVTNSTQVPAPKLCAPAIPSHGACVPRQRAPLGSLGRRKKQLSPTVPGKSCQGKAPICFPASRLQHPECFAPLLLRGCGRAPAAAQAQNGTPFEDSIVQHALPSGGLLLPSRVVEFSDKSLRYPQTPLPSFLCAKLLRTSGGSAESRGRGLLSQWAVGGAAGVWVLSKGDWGVVRGVSCDRLYCTYRGTELRPLLTCGLSLMSALEKSMHLGRLPSRPPLPGSGGSQSGAKMRMGYVTCTSLPGGQAQAIGEWCLGVQSTMGRDAVNWRKCWRWPGDA